MSIKDYLVKNKNIESSLLEFLENESNTESDFQKIISIIDEQKIITDKHELTLFFLLISKLSQYHYRDTHFILKLEKIIQNYSNDIEQNLTSLEIFKIFGGSKRLLLFLFEEKILKMDEQISDIITKSDEYVDAKYLQYFSPELKPFIKEEIENELPENFYELRKIGENESVICNLIRNDSIVDFIVFINKNNYSLNSKINLSIYETHSYLIQHQPTLIKYAAFFGSIQIFNYLLNQKVESDSKLIKFAIHGKNHEIIQVLEPHYEDSYKKCIKESIRCHYNDITNYFLDNYFIDFKNQILYENIDHIFMSYNFSFILTEPIDEITFFYACKYNYYYLVYNILSLNDKDFNVNKKFIGSNSDIKMETTSVFYAVKNGNYDIVQLLLNNEKIDANDLNVINSRDKYEEKTILNLAIEENNIEIIKLLLNNEKVDINKLNFIEEIEEKQITALYLAVENENIEIVQLLLKSEKLDVNALNYFDEYLGSPYYNERNDEKTALYLAIEKGNIEIIKLLLTHKKIDVNIINKITEIDESTYTKDNYEETILYAAVRNEKIEVIKLLLSHETMDVNKLNTYINDLDNIEEKKTALYEAVNLENIEIIKFLLENENINVNILNTSSAWCNYECEYRIFEEKEETSLFLAIKKENIDIVKLLAANSKIDFYINNYSSKTYKYYYTVSNYNKFNDDYEETEI